ncbi:MAG: glycosyltransferase family 4 protein [Trueperaceae bacterium]|nr:glycosyltransferase family 4 protein [Trueperaceae bacterium]MCO5174941.1 glycosyltransferase family 4 protein [Trueperaceae bacterium]
MSKVVLLAPNYWPESNAGAKRITALARFLATRGWEVTVLTLLPHHPQNEVYPGYSGPTPRHEYEAQVRIVRLQPWLVPKANLKLRLASESLFAIKALGFLLREPFDVIFASSPYMFLGQTAHLASLIRGRPFAWDIRDLIWLYPRAAGKRTLGTDLALGSLMRFTARRAHLITTTTERQLEYFLPLKHRNKVIANGVATELFDSLSKLPTPFADTSKRPLAAYVGLFGFNQELEVVIDTARLMPETDFLLVGDGPEREALVKRANSLSNVSFLPYQPTEKLLDIYSNCDILISHIRRNPTMRSVQPAKVWEYLATARPVVHAAEGELADMIGQRNLAYVVTPGDPAKLAASLRSVMTRRDDAVATGVRGRSFIREHRIREHVFEALEAELQALTSGGT